MRLIAHQGHNKSGFTLIEVLVTISVLSVLMMLAAPSLQDIFIKNKIRTIADDFHQGIFKAKNTAISKNTCTTMCMAQNLDAENPQCKNSGSDWQAGWIIFLNPDCDTSINQASSAANVLEIRKSVGDEYFLNSQSSTPKRKIMFNARGTLQITNSDEFDLIYKSPGNEKNNTLSLNICLDALGRVRNVPSENDCKSYK